MYKINFLIFGLVSASFGVVIPDMKSTCALKCPSNSTPYQNPNHQKTANGCGSKGIIVDVDLLPKPEIELCCNAHDYCYDTCDSGKSNCDLTFKNCMLGVCETSRNVESLYCKATAEVFYNIVKDIGCVSYLDSQKNTCLCP